MTSFTELDLLCQSKRHVRLDQIYVLNLVLAVRNHAAVQRKIDVSVFFSVLSKMRFCFVVYKVMCWIRSFDTVKKHRNTAGTLFWLCQEIEHEQIC